MSRTLAELDPGTIIWFNTTLSGEDAATPFIVMGTSQQGNSVLIMPKLYYAGHRMNPTNTTEYNGSEMDTWLMSEESSGYRMSYLSAAFRNCLVSTTIESYSIEQDATLSLSRDIFLASETEVGNASTHPEGVSYLDALKTAADTTNNNTARIAYNTAGVAGPWWLRSPASAAQFRYVNANGYAYGINAAYGNSVRPIYSVAPATLVSDQGADTIYLFPDSAAAYREIDITIGMGQSTNRPKKARILTAVTNATESSIQATNNYKDATPTWETVGTDGTVTFANATKTTDNWELGVKLYAKSQTKATFTEPAMIVETEE